MNVSTSIDKTDTEEVDDSNKLFQCYIVMCYIVIRYIVGLNEEALLIRMEHLYTYLLIL